MPSAFFTGLSGLRSHQGAVQVVANNVANLNSVAFKGSRADFRDLFYQNIGLSRSGVASQIGLGVSPITVSRRFEQGTIQSTAGLLDAAIQGEGFFVVSDGGVLQFTRSGNFQLNSNQELVTINGEIVQGWNRDPASGAVNSSLPIADINLQGNDRIEPRETTTLRISANLATGSTLAFARPVQVFDSLGASHIVTLVFNPVVPPRAGFSSSFDVTATLPTQDLIDAGGNPPASVPNIAVNAGAPPIGFPIDFDASGDLVNPAPGTPYQIVLDMAQANDSTTPGAVNALPVTFANGAADLVVTWDLLNLQLQPTISSVAASSSITDILQDGRPSAELTSISVADGGRISGLFSDGRTLVLAQLALQRFTNPQSLLAVGNNNYIPTAASSVSSPGEPDSGGLGSVIGLSLEFSNVDISQEFTDLLTFQRGFQANSRVITTADQLNQEALNLIR
ncbi:MAG: flagellar hook protein FlgE [Bryobacterales bacterium]